MADEMLRSEYNLAFLGISKEAKERERMKNNCPTEMPLGTKLLLLHGLGWKHKIELKEGIIRMYEWYKGNKK